MDKQVYDELFIGDFPPYERLIEIEDELLRLRKCMKFALSLRPLPTDPLQEYARRVCPEIIEEWEEQFGK